MQAQMLLQGLELPEVVGQRVRGVPSEYWVSVLVLALSMSIELSVPCVRAGIEE